jgi:hypothetical protein
LDVRAGEGGVVEVAKLSHAPQGVVDRLTTEPSAAGQAVAEVMLAAGPGGQQAKRRLNRAESLVLILELAPALRRQLSAGVQARGLDHIQAQAERLLAIEVHGGAPSALLFFYGDYGGHDA